MPSHVAETSSTPLDRHQQLRIVRTRLTEAQDGPQHVEYRVYNWRRLSSGRVVRGDASALSDVLCIAAVSLAGWRLHSVLGASQRWDRRRWVSLTRSSGPPLIDPVMGPSSSYTCSVAPVPQDPQRPIPSVFDLELDRGTPADLAESVVPLPDLGLQLSTTRGLSLPHPGRFSSAEHRWLVPLSKSHTFIPLPDISTVIINEGLRRWNVRYYLAVVKRRGGGVVVALNVSPHLSGS
jgi:phosphatidylinositol glycan class H protein